MGPTPVLRTLFAAGLALGLAALTAPPAAAEFSGGGCGTRQEIRSRAGVVYGTITACISGEARRLRPDLVHGDAYVKLTRHVPGCKVKLWVGNWSDQKIHTEYEFACPKADGVNRRFVLTPISLPAGGYETGAKLWGTSFTSFAPTPYSLLLSVE